jgi:transcriptional regulator with XRE-family HTH domain
VSLFIFVYHWERGDNLPHLDTLVKIADVLQVTLDELVGRKEPSAEVKIRNHELQQLYQLADQLPDADQQALIQVMDGLVKKAQLQKLMGKAAKG